MPEKITAVLLSYAERETVKYSRGRAMGKLSSYRVQEKVPMLLER